jgi:ABC-2 type transport system ATP-binding protein
LSALVEVQEASLWYGPVLGVNEVTLDLDPGVTGLLGPNGAGKSTLMKLMAGLLRPSLGEVRVEGLPVWKRAAARRRIGYSPEVDGFYEEMSGGGFVRAMARLSGLGRAEARRRTEAALEQVGMAALTGKRIAACSKGMRQRLKLAQALVHDPAVLILDEPLNGIDPAGRADLMDLFRRLGASGKTVLISTHILHEVQEVTDRIVLMARGRVLASGTVGAIRALLEDHPLTVRIGAGRMRELASELMAREEVVGVALDGEGDELVVKVRHPDRFFRALPALVLEHGVEVERVEPLDASAEAIFDYLVGGGGHGGAP